MGIHFFAAHPQCLSPMGGLRLPSDHLEMDLGRSWVRRGATADRFLHFENSHVFPEFYTARLGSSRITSAAARADYGYSDGNELLCYVDFSDAYVL